MESWLCVLGAVFTDKPIVQPLSPSLWFGHIHARKRQYREVTKPFTALSMGISELEAFYFGVDFAAASEARFFPHITSFITDTGSKIRFCYERYADPDPKTTKAVFIANTQDDRKIIVKFAEAYNEEAHSLLVAEGLAPPLLYCDRPAFSNFTMIVMDYVDGEQLFYKYPQVTPAKVLEEVSKTLKTLHEKGFVPRAGDPRSPNIESLQTSTAFSLWISTGVGAQEKGSTWQTPTFLISNGRMVSFLTAFCSLNTTGRCSRDCRVEIGMVFVNV